MKFRGPLTLAAAWCALATPGCFIVSVERDYVDAREVKVAPAELSRVRRVRSGDEVPRFREANVDRLSRLGPGSSVADFRREFPSAVFVERRGEVDCYRVDHAERYRYGNSSKVYEVNDGAWFFFRQERLVKWGARQDWPE